MAAQPAAPGTHGTNVTPGTHGADDLHGDPAAERLVALARNAHRNVGRNDLNDDVDYWYRLGQRNAFAHAAGILIGHGVDSTAFAVSERLTTALEAGVTDLGPLHAAVIGGPVVGGL